jgi:hypothetical protein
MALAFKTKKAAKEALAASGTLGPEHVIETSFFGSEYRDGTFGVVVSTEPGRVRNSFASITIVGGRIVSIK